MKKYWFLLITLLVFIVSTFSQTSDSAQYVTNSKVEKLVDKSIAKIVCKLQVKPPLLPFLNIAMLSESIGTYRVNGERNGFYQESIKVNEFINKI